MLKIHFVDNRQGPVWLADERFTIGQDSRNDLVIDDPEVGPFHAEIRQEHGFYYLTDIGSQSGTYVNDEKIGARFQIRSGDRVRLGGVALDFIDPAKAASKTGPAPRWLLQVIQGENQGHKYHVIGSMTFGRSVKCELCFSDPELSRRHAEFYLKGDVLEVKDLASANGILVNQQKVTTAVLQPGDQIQLGSVTLLVIGPKVQVPQAIDEDATVFVQAVELPKPEQAEKPEKPKAPRRPHTPNPLRAATPRNAEPSVATRSVSRRWPAVLAGAVVLIAAALALPQLL
ncbi:FHA domain-containing protein [Stutzerimonas nosocomialis]|uniref:FHA domain-containing protein n=1 Tax=Stutzerimonas nosocomialis TaxID=1056496 RepID=A0A5R9Q9M1_9GAMM|nr:FHA domain-containing protein [Stutzerimonas nosocomialis]TLX53453.1 FHA domain-containing protein [Stutzerimonas nosocomialis]TLX56424.1 FHA domain-containing protein [Stutzerimonas nosocomialis]TLX61814.1 FHA domain-containing protein [Stutzerimonas nosocomialis]